MPGQKPKMSYVKRDERIENIMEEYDELNDMYKGLKALIYNTC